MDIFNESKLGVVCHDAGGSEILSSYLISNKLKPIYCLDGPAITIFQKKLGMSFSIKTCSQVLNEADIFLCGTSWQSDLERRIVEGALKKDKPVITVLDHWMNYKERMRHNGLDLLPSEFWVCDKYALEIASANFPSTPIKLIENPFYNEIREIWPTYTNKNAKTNINNLLFLSDNLAEGLDSMFGNCFVRGYTDRDSLNYLIKNLPTISNDINNITIRLHPSENKANYLWALKKYPRLLKISSKDNLLEDLAAHQIVVGSESMAMVVALICGKRVLSAIPPGAVKCCLPHHEIELLRDMV